MGCCSHILRLLSTPVPLPLSRRKMLLLGVLMPLVISIGLMFDHDLWHLGSSYRVWAMPLLVMVWILAIACGTWCGAFTLGEDGHIGRSYTRGISLGVIVFFVMLVPLAVMGPLGGG